MDTQVGAEDLNEIEELQTILDKALLDGSQTLEHYLNLGRAYDERYDETYQQQDLQSAISFYKSGLENCPGDTRYQLELLDALGRTLRTHYEDFGNLSYLEEAVTCHTQALNICPLDNPDRPTYLINHAVALWIRYEQLGVVEDLEKAIDCNEQALDLCPPGHPARSSSLNNFAIALHTRYEQIGDLKDLEKALNYNEQGLNLCPPGHPGRSSSLNNLATTLQARYEQLGAVEDLEKAIDCHEQALDLCPPGHPDRSTSLNNLANAVCTRYEQLGVLQDLENAIGYNKQALELCPAGHPNRSSSLNILANILYTRYKQLGGMEDLEMAINCNEQALDLHPLGHPDRSSSLDNLSTALGARYQQLGIMEDLEKAIKCHEQALELCPPNHPDRSSPLNNLAIALHTRYKQIGVMDDLEKAIHFHERALDLRTHSHPHRSLFLNNLASTLQTRYEQLGVMDDLEKAIDCHEQALILCPPGHSNRSFSVNNLASALYTRYEHLGVIEDLEKVISYHEQGLDLRPSGHPNRSSSLSNLATAFQARYEQLGVMEDLEKAINCYEQALNLCLSGHPDRSFFLNKLGHVFYSQYVKFGQQENLKKAITYHSEAASVISSLSDRLTAAKQWAIIAHRHGFSSAIPAYSLALDLLQQHLTLLPSLTSQQKQVERSSYLSLDAAACAIANDMSEMAVQLLEQGRSILWSKIQGYRQTLGEISERSPELANEFQIVSKQLDHSATSGSVDITLQRALSERWAALLANIRQLDGFSDYLQATPFRALQSATAEGPVIIVNISRFRSDAIILISHSLPAVVPLCDASPQKLKQLVDQVSSATTSSNPPKLTYKVLQQLWKVIVNPVVEQLLSGIPEKSHIWWCPTSYLCALPLHAAGPYTKGLKNLPDLYISSYTPTLTSLIRARYSMPKPQSVPALLLVSQPDGTIPHVFEEAKIITSFNMQVNSWSEYNADKQEVVLALQSHPWVHFACHGHLANQPFNSWFQLHNGEHLTVLDLAKAELPNAEFAFLSACHSAAGGVRGTPDESIHLAGALQFSGFKSVVGTLWAMVDDDGPSIANAFYRYIFCNPDHVDLRDAARALNIATKELRRKMVPVDRWINFIHIGA